MPKERRSEGLRIAKHTRRIANRPILAFHSSVMSPEVMIESAVKGVVGVSPNSSAKHLVVADESNEFVVANTSLFMCFRLTRVRSRKTKTTKLMASASTTKLSPKGGKGTDKGRVQQIPVEESYDSEGIYSTYLAFFGNEGQAEDSSPASIYELEDDQLLEARRAELRSKFMHDLSRILVPPRPPTAVAPASIP
uniref:Uncharacterized protein n=1 Tax=Solanum tuberosum TaxID=4113 RepID=M1DQI8_SOLTU